MIKRIKALVPFLLCLSLFVLLFAPCAGATGTDSASSEKGSITVDILLADGTPVPGGTLTAYLVGTAKGNNYVYVKPFGEEGTVIDSDTINNAEAGAPELAAALASKTEGASGKTVTVDNNGRAVFTDLPLGLYLIVQNKTAAGYEPVRSFLVTVPMWVDGKPVYDVYANPKPSVAYKEAVLKLPVEKIVINQGGTPDPNEQFAFLLTPREKNAPMPVNGAAVVDEETGAQIVVRRGAGAVSFGSIVYGLDDVGKTYTYMVEELPGDNSHYKYDTRKYFVMVAVAMEDDVITVHVRYVCSDNTTVTNMSFVNRHYNRTPGTPALPQTGQRWWPVSVLAGLGLGLFLLGWWLRRKGAGNP